MMVALASNKLEQGRARRTELKEKRTMTIIFKDICEGAAAIKQRGAIKLLRNSKMLAKVN